jgi:flagellar assembly protein FliH
MTSSSNSGNKGFPNIPPPPGAKAGGTYARIIPREELGEFSSWQPGAFGAVGAPPDRRSRPRAEAAEVPTIQEWHARIAEARKAGYQDGYRDGLVGLESFKQAHATQSAAQIGQLLQAIEEQWSQLEPSMAQAVARAAVLLARRVLRQEVQARPEHVVSLAQEAVGAIMMSARRIEVHVHPEDLELVAAGAGELLKSRSARLVGDARISRGGCRVNSDIGTVEATLAARWADAAATLGSDLPLDDVDAASTPQESVP